MEKKFPAPANEVRQLYSKISHIVESRSGVEPQRLVRDWSPKLFEDMRSEAEVLMLMHGQSVSDRYLYGVCSALAAMRAENGGFLPPLSVEQYEMDKETQTSHEAAQDEAAYAYFEKLETAFIERLPLTATLVVEMGKDLKWRLGASSNDIHEGFVPGWRRAVRTVVPLLIEE
jgi:hypothetical protein